MVQPLFSFLIRRASFFRRVEQSYAYCLVIDLYACLPLAVFASNTRKSACVARRFFSVMRISNVGGFAQINQSVVCAVVINMINLIRRPHAVSIKPRKPVRSVQEIVYTNADIPMLHHTPCHGTLTAFSPGYSPLKKPGIRVIINKFFQPLYGKFGHHMHSFAPFVYINAAAHGGQS